MRQTPPVKLLRDRAHSAFHPLTHNFLFSFGELETFFHSERKRKNSNLNNKCIHLSGRVFMISPCSPGRKILKNGEIFV